MIIEPRMEQSLWGLKQVFFEAQFFTFEGAIYQIERSDMLAK